MPTLKTATEPERNSIRGSYASAIGATAVAVIYFQDLADPTVTLDPDELKVFQNELIQARKDLSLLKQQLDAFENNRVLGNVKAPSSDDVANIGQLASQIALDTAADNRATAIATNLTSLLTALHAAT